MIFTTLNKIREHQPCTSGWKKLLNYLGKTEADDEPLPLTTILDSNGLDDCLWALRTVPEHNNLWRKYAVWCASQAEHLMDDEMSKNVLVVAWDHAEGKATDDELAAARDAASASAWDAARAATWDAARAAASASAWDAAWDAARAATWDAARAAARAVALAAARDAASASAWDAARAAARAVALDAAWDAQTAKLHTVLTSGELT